MIDAPYDHCICRRIRMGAVGAVLPRRMAVKALPALCRPLRSVNPPREQEAELRLGGQAMPRPRDGAYPPFGGAAGPYMAADHFWVACNNASDSINGGFRFRRTHAFWDRTTLNTYGKSFPTPLPRGAPLQKLFTAVPATGSACCKSLKVSGTGGRS